jgi:hypothetical protein
LAARQPAAQQIAAHGYLDGPFELEAEAKAVKACHVFD